jgi:lactate permease
MTLTPLTWLLALSPVVVVLIFMLGLHWGGSKAGALAWFSAVLVALAFLGATPRLIAYTQVKGILLSLDVLYIIWAALLLYQTAEEAGAVRRIGQALVALTPDRTLQGLLIGWLFVSFIQGFGGFGVPVAVAAPLLVGLGFSPVQAVLMACLGHGWAVNFGSLATSFQSLLAVTNLSGELLGPPAAVLMGISALPSGMMVAFIAGGWAGLKHTFPVVLALSLVMAVSQYLIVLAGVWTLGATGAAILGLLAGFAITRLPAYRPGSAAQTNPAESGASLWAAFSAYAILIVLAFSFNLIPALGKWFGGLVLTLPFPALSTTLGWQVAAESGRKISLLTHPGAILLYSSILAYLVYARVGLYRPGALRRIANRTARSAINSSLGIVAMVGISVVMSNTGMTNLLAQGLSEGIGRAFYPAVAPFLGALGAFITGSNNNANVLFGALQMRTAELLGLSTPLILAAQTAGGSLGSIMAPAKVIVGCSTVGLNDKESAVLRPILVYGLILIGVVSATTFVFSLLKVWA